MNAASTMDMPGMAKESAPQGKKGTIDTLLDFPKSILWDPWAKEIPTAIIGVGKQLLNSFWPF